MLKGIIFDFDGVIIDTEYPHFQAWQECFQDFDCSLPLEEWAVCIGTADNFDPIAYLQAQIGRTVDREAVEKKLYSRKAELTQKEALLPGVHELVREAHHAGISLAVASSSSYRWVHGHLEQQGIADYFKIIRTKENVERVKPEPDLYLSALDGLGISHAEAIVFEDSPNGIAAAKTAGIYCIAVPNRLTAQLDVSRANQIINPINAIPLRELMGMEIFSNDN